MGEHSLSSIWSTEKLNGRVLDVVIELERKGIFPLPMFRLMTDQFSKTQEEILEVVQGEIARFATMNCWDERLAGRVLALKIAQDAGWIPVHEISQQDGLTLKDIEDLNEREFDEWIAQLRSTGARVTVTRSGSPSP